MRYGKLDFMDPFGAKIRLYWYATTMAGTESRNGGLLLKSRLLPAPREWGVPCGINATRREQCNSVQWSRVMTTSKLLLLLLALLLALAGCTSTASVNNKRIPCPLGTYFSYRVFCNSIGG